MRDVVRPTIAGIRAVTYAAPDLTLVEESYTRWLGYRVVARGALSRAVAAAWHAPALAGRPYLTLAPESGERCYLRFIAAPESAGWRALTTHGWNVSEFVVQDVDALADRLAESPFQVIGGPASLTRFPMIRAMQVVGPFGECLYFTEVGEGSGLDLAPARSFVGRVFIVVVGAPDLEDLSHFYMRFANEMDPPVATPVRVISLVNDLPADTQHLHGLVKLGGGTLIELDEYPRVTRTRWRIGGALPAGMAMVTLGVDTLADRDGSERLLLPDEDAAARVILGAVGELIELTEWVDA